MLQFHPQSTFIWKLVHGYETPTATNWNQNCCSKNLYLKYVRICCNAAAKCVQQDGANVDLIISISSAFGCSVITCDNPLNVVEESDNEDEL